MTRIWIAGLALCGLTACMGAPQHSGKQLYSENCAVCHGASGMGDGEFADKLFKPPADLTRLSARNGGVFPRDYVISTMDGYARGDHFSGAMPEFGVKLAGKTVLLESNDGAVTPTPGPLLAISDYLESIQVKDGG